MNFGTVSELWRYPVKSFGGERLDSLEIDRRGIVGDRRWALVDPEGKLASGKPTRRFRKVRGLLMHRAQLENGKPLIELADGRSMAVDDPAAGAVAEELAGPGWVFGEEREVPHYDAAPVHLVTSRTLEQLESLVGGEFPSQRLRPNVVIEWDGAPGFAEDGWTGRNIRIGEVELRVVERTERCVMVNHARPGIEHRSDVLKTIGRANEACAGVYAEVVATGRIELGASVELL
ncbi:MAG TPA: MOSC N-terminal beta barrel domain-containing protein [Thermoleophilaceae bacterium]|nr:MOSC N-terminal beta barrel domain-containing protein [Thermoleophilaceae bacterium]